MPDFLEVLAIAWWISWIVALTRRGIIAHVVFILLTISLIGIVAAMLIVTALTN